MPKFEKQFVYFTWDDVLKGKKVFYANYIDSLKYCVKNNANMQHVIEEGDPRYPFMVDEDTWAFVYYDPLYELKLAYEQGETIQVFENGVWCDCLDPTSWTLSPEAYRVKPEEKPITNRELSRWIAQGNGEWIYSDRGYYSIKVSYLREVENQPIDKLIKVRKWEDTEWVKPTREYMGLD